jgi:hypothetical protein
MRRRRVWIAAAVVLALALVGTALFVRGRNAPEPARLLPESEAVIYLNLKPLRLATNFGDKPVTHEPEYENFIRETGFQFERDLDELATAVHAAEPNVAGGKLDMQRRFSHLFIGKFDSTRLKTYLGKLASSKQSYRDTEIFEIPYEGRTVRVAILSVDTVAVSNTTDINNLKGMIDRYRKIALPFGGPELVRDYFRHVPFTSTAWAIARLRSEDGKETLPLPNGISFQLPNDTVTVASLRYTGSVQFKAEAFTPNAGEAKSLADSANTFLQLFRSIEVNTGSGGNDPDVRQFFDSLKVEQQDERAILTAELPQGFLKKMMTEAPQAAVAQEPPKEPEPATKKKSKPKKK